MVGIAKTLGKRVPHGISLVPQLGRFASEPLNGLTKAWLIKTIQLGETLSFSALTLGPAFT
jgi:hypothetical protein